ncbi:MAG: addiction module protein [Bacteroidota bacterium]
MKELQQQILQLPPGDRLQLIAFIAASLSTDALNQPFEVPEAWVQEALGRNQSIEIGDKAGLSWEETKAKVYRR